LVAIAYVYCRADPNEARQAKVLTADEARRIAANIARLGSCWGRGATTELSGERAAC
jgi:hypothetical protein